MMLFDLLDDSASAPTRLVFLTQNRVMSFGDVWRDAARLAGWARTHVDPDRSIAAVLDTSPECLAFVLGVLRAGRRLASLPLPTRTSSLEHYEVMVRSILRNLNAGVLAVDERFAPLLPALDVPVVSFQQAVGRGGASQDESTMGGELLQFTSGTTAQPRGVRVPVRQIGANVTAILDRLDPRPGDGACSWLPLSHDMGLIGMTLAALSAGATRHANGGDVVLIAPDHFLRDPSVWLDACSSYRTTITATPDFGLSMAMRRAPRMRSLDLRSLRACIVGGEPIRATTLERFERAYRDSGFRSQAFCPSYGMAEATLAVTMTAPDEHWSDLRLDRDALALGKVSPVGEGGTRLVANGPALRDTDVSVSSRTGIGRLTVRGPGVFEGYLGGAPANGELVTEDQGFVRDGRLFVTGRLDDVLVVRGRNLFAVDLEDAVERVADVRRGSCVVVRDPPGYTVVFESGCGLGHNAALSREIRQTLIEQCGIAPWRTLQVARNTVPKTSSGKKQRRHVESCLARGELEIVHELRSSSSQYHAGAATPSTSREA
jgi:acyl-CoA synthetase (AMP-forming)/AMP-acid ligase II